MLDIHLFGEFRKFAEHSKPTDNSVVSLTFKEEETLQQLLARIGINPLKTGELLINFAVASLESKIPSDGSRISIFPIGMHLICGGSHLKGHSFVTKNGPQVNYYGKPEIRSNPLIKPSGSD